MYSEMVKELNTDRFAKGPEIQEETCKELSKRDRALEFARKIPKPMLKNSRSKTVHNGFRNVRSPGQENLASHMEFLESQHQLYQRRLNSITN